MPFLKSSQLRITASPSPVNPRQRGLEIFIAPNMTDYAESSLPKSISAFTCLSMLHTGWMSLDGGSDVACGPRAQNPYSYAG